jgi:hypothetical protein
MNSPERNDSPEQVKRRAIEQRAAFKSSFDALQDKLEEEVGQVESAVRKARDAHTSVQRYRWPAVAVSVLAGAVLGARRRRTVPLRLGKGDGERIVYVQTPQRLKAPSLIGLLVARIGAALVAEAMAFASARYAEREAGEDPVHRQPRARVQRPFW